MNNHFTETIHHIMDLCHQGIKGKDRKHLLTTISGTFRDDDNNLSAIVVDTKGYPYKLTVESWLEKE